MYLSIPKKSSPPFLPSRERHLCLYKRDKNRQIDYCDSFMFGLRHLVEKIKQDTAKSEKSLEYLEM